MTLFDDLQDIARAVKRNLPKMKRSEAATISVSISPFIRALGYNSQDLDEVYPQYPILNTDAVDYAILRDDAPVIFVEAKSAGNKLQNKEWKQLFQYFNAEIGLRIGILTNGVEYRFYTDHKADNIMDEEPFMTLDLLNLDKRKVEVLAGFTKARFDPSNSIKNLKIREKVETILHHPDEWFVKHVIHNIHEGQRSKTTIDRYRPLVKRAIDDFVDNKIEQYLREQNGETDPPPDPITDCINVPVSATYKGHQFEATLLVDEVMNWHKRPILVWYQGELLGYVDAMLQAMRSISPNRKTGRTGLLFWQFKHPDSGESLPIKVICADVQKKGPLRQQLAKKYLDN